LNSDVAASSELKLNGRKTSLAGSASPLIVMLLESLSFPTFFFIYKGGKKYVMRIQVYMQKWAHYLCVSPPKFFTHSSFFSTQDKTFLSIQFLS
jgi:hypothetical protein